MRWGILGVSGMVGRLAVLPALRDSPTAALVAIASRDAARAQAEADAFGAARAYGSYAALLDDAEVEAVYIPLPNALHREWTIAALRSGRHVLCEKPLACTAAEAVAMAEAAQSSRRTLMEAYMTAFHPRARRAVELAREGALGKLQAMRSVFTFPNRDPLNHRWLAEMGGGALLDVGIYCLEPLLKIGGEPVRVAGSSIAAPSGVDASFSGWLEFDDGLTASFLASFDAPELQRLEVVGSEAAIACGTAFTAGAHDNLIDIQHRDGRRESLDAGACNPYLAMVEHFARVVAGEEESLRPPADSVRTLAVIDRVRATAGERK